MHLCSRPVWLGSLLLALGVLVSSALPVAAQQGEPPSPASPRPVSVEEQNQTELLRSYIQLREQLHATQLSVVNSRVEAETAARVQAAALTEKLDAIKAAMDTERERQRVEAVRVTAERERQEAAARQTQQTVIWVAGIFGVLAVLTLLLVPFFQWRALNRVVEGVAARSATPVPLPSTPLPAIGAGPSDHVVELSNQRLMSVIDRVEQRVIELEQTASRHPSPPSPATDAGAAPGAVASSHSAPGPAAMAAAAAQVEMQAARKLSASVSEPDPRITLLLGRGRQLLGANKARDALSCYDEILKIEANHTEALVKKGAALERLKRDEEAIWCYDRAIESDRKMTLAYLYKGGVYNRQGRYDDALECYEQALQTAEDTAQ